MVISDRIWQQPRRNVMIHRSYHDSLTVRVDHLKTEELERVEKTIQLLDDFSNLFSITWQRTNSGILIALISILVAFLVFFAVAMSQSAQSNTLTENILDYPLVLWVVILSTVFLGIVGGLIGHRKGEKEKAKKMPKLLQEAVFLGQQSTLCCNMLRLAFAQDENLRKIQTTTLTKLFDLYQGIDS